MSIIKVLRRISKEMRRHHDAQIHPQPIPRHELHGNRSEKISVWGNSFLAIFTLVAIGMAYVANRTSQKSLEYTISKDSINSIIQIAKDSIDSSDRAFNRRYIDSSLQVTKQYAKAMQVQSNASKASVDVSMKSAIFYRESIILENEAYIFIDSIVINQPVRDGQSAIVTFSVRNMGKTPAYKVKTATITTFAETEMDTIFNQYGNRENFYDAPTFLPSNQNHHSIIKSVILDGIDFVRYEKKMINLFILINIQYFDVFNKVHRVRFFYELVSGENTFRICGRFNEPY